MPDTAIKAVFLSYAREDSDAARRIADALRSGGVEVWFDQSELRGGEAWDRKIRHQIKECALFLPVVSAHTQERREGYFRLEWKLAVERTHLMMEGVPFLAPVVVDGTREDAGMVPEPFLAVQWIRLPSALPTPEFVAQIKRLLNSPSDIATAPKSAAETAPPVQPVAPRSGASTWAAMALGGAALALAAYLALRPVPKQPTAPAGPAKTTADAKPEPGGAKAGDKSIAVLPFANMSEEKDSAFFADGVHEDILTSLALIRELRVVSRTTAMQYRDTKKTLRQIGEELGVAYILEGSVRRAGNKVRVTGQLINARTDEHVWARAFDRDLTDIFAIQSALAQEIATALQTALTPQTQKLIERRPTANVAAYDLFLKGRDLRYRARTSRVTLKQAEALFQGAVDLDPSFAAAWGELAVNLAYQIFYHYDNSPTRLVQADAAIGKAVRLAPEAPDVIRLLGNYALYAYRDYARAAAQYEKLARLQPNEPTLYSSLGLLQRRQGRWPEALANLRKAAQLDPGNLAYARNLVTTLAAGRRWADAIAEQRRLMALVPDQLTEQRYLAGLVRYATGSRTEEEEFFSRLPPAQRDSPRMIYYRKFNAAARGDFTEFKRLDQLHPYFDEDGTPRSTQAGQIAWTYFTHGDAAAAIARIGNFPADVRARLAAEPANVRLWGELGGMELILGHHDEALRCARKMTELIPESLDAYDGPRMGVELATFYAWTGDKDRAVADLTRLIHVPAANLNASSLRRGRTFSPLRGDPRFEALVNDPKNDAPLF